MALDVAAAYELVDASVKIRNGFDMISKGLSDDDEDEGMAKKTEQAF